jgi:hypothetical protein
MARSTQLFLDVIVIGTKRSVISPGRIKINARPLDFLQLHRNELLLNIAHLAG